MNKSYTQQPPVVMTIAGVDSSGGAGVAADLKTFAALGVHGTCAVTAITAQNTMGVARTFPLPPDLVRAQIEANVSDLGCQALKTGMLGTREIIDAVYRSVREYRLKNLVVDPVMVATSGALLLEPGAKEMYRDTLIPLARVITPNVPEAEALLEQRIESVEQMADAARSLAELGCDAVVITGGHLLKPGQATDVVYDRKSNRARFLVEPALKVATIHGSGCVYAAALAAYLAQGQSVFAAAGRAKEFTLRAIRHGLDLGAGAGPVNPLFNLRKEDPA